jgi:hypothetical protein
MEGYLMSDQKFARVVFAAAAVVLALSGCKRLRSIVQGDPPDAGGSGASATAAATAANGGVGVPECDRFLGEYSCYLHKVSPATADGTISQTQSGWAAAAVTPQGKLMLVDTCTKMQQSMAPAIAQNGCTGVALGAGGGAPGIPPTPTAATAPTHAAAPKVVQCAPGLVRIVVAGQPAGACVHGCGSICGSGQFPVEATALNDDGSHGGKVNVEPPSAAPPTPARPKTTFVSPAGSTFTSCPAGFAYRAPPGMCFKNCASDAICGTEEKCAAGFGCQPK